MHPGVSYAFRASSVDPDGDSTSVRFEWGDGDTSAWSPYVTSGDIISMSHSRTTAGIIHLKAHAKDYNNYYSGWSDVHTITIGDTSDFPLEVVATIPVGDGPEGVAASPDGDFVYVANWFSDNVSIIQTSTNTVTDSVPVGSGPRAVCVLPSGDYACVTNYYGGTISVIQTSSDSVVATVTVGTNPEGIACLRDGSHACVSNYYGDDVSVIGF